MQFKLLDPENIFGKPMVFELDLNASEPLLIRTKWGVYMGRARVSKGSLEIMAYTEEHPKRGILCHLQENGMVRIQRGDPLIHTWQELGWIYQGQQPVSVKRIS
jgi:hypothetical protein